MVLLEWLEALFCLPSKHRNYTLLWIWVQMFSILNCLAMAIWSDNGGSDLYVFSIFIVTHLAHYWQMKLIMRCLTCEIVSIPGEKKE